MKLLLCTVLVCLFLVTVSIQAAPAPTVSVTAPTGGTLTGGDVYRITWTDPGTSFAAVYYSTNGDKWSTLYSCNKNAHRYDWTVPEIDSDAQIKVESWVSCGDDSPYATGLSDDFEIESGLPDPCSCDSCQSCSELLEGSCETVTLSRDITSSSGQCINFGADDKTFDCDGHEIKGGATSQEFYYGIFARGDGITIQDCEISEFVAGIDLHYVSGGLIKDCTLNDNYGSGMFIAQSDGIELKDNIIEGSAQGIYLANSSDMDFDGNYICGSWEGDIVSSPWGTEQGNTKDGNTCDLIYNWNGDNDVTWCDDVCNAGESTTVNTGSGLQGALNGEFGEVTLNHDVSLGDGLQFEGSHITVDCDNHVISGSGTGIGILMENRVNNEIRNCRIENYGTGVELRGTSHSRITSNMIKNNDYGLIIREGAIPSIGNEIRDNLVSENSLYGAYMDGNAFGNVFRDNTLLGEHYSLHSTADCDNDIDVSNEGAASFPIGYFHDESGLSISSGPSYSALILCNVDNSEFSGVSAGAGGSDGIVIRESENTVFDYPHVQFAYNGIIIEDSEGVAINGAQVQNTEHDCISVSQSEGTIIDQGSLRDCERGIALSFSSGSIVADISITNNAFAAIQLHTATETTIDETLIEGGGGKGIVLNEGSDNNEISGNMITGTIMGVQIDATSDGNVLESNIICDNSADIYDYGTDNTGNTNNCSVSVGWGDDAYGKGCEFCCTNIRSDINKDGVDNACDCYDAYQSNTEDGVDCGGRCGDCVECTWCGSDLDPMRVKGSPNSGMIDIVFVPHRDFKNNLTIFENDAYKYVREHYLRLDEYSYTPLPDGFEDSFNFYLYRDGYGYSGDCAGKLPGESDYKVWLGTCTAACIASLGIACGCYAHEPDHFYGDAGWADTAGILTMGAAGCANTLGPQSHFISERAYPVVIHESGHAVFGLVDEYCGDTHYEQNNPHPNVWKKKSSCESYASSHGWTLGTCTKIQSGSCSKGYYRYDVDVPINSYMTVWNGGWNYKFWEACSERIAYVFEHYPGGGSRGVLVYVNSSADGMKKVGTTVVEGHPDLGMQVAVYWGEVLSAGEERIKEFGLWDHRKPLASGPGSEASTLDSIVFPVNFPFKDNPRWLNIYNASSGELVISMDLAYELYGWCAAHDWEGDDCASLDLDNNGVPDAQETSDWDPTERIVEESFSDREDLEVEELPESIPEDEEESNAPETTETPELIGGTPVSGIDGLEIILVLVLSVVVILVVAVVLKKRK